jgi:peptidoglycan/xylan/chitin deacetylase (PgdA/CDA1 family)
VEKIRVSRAEELSEQAECNTVFSADGSHTTAAHPFACLTYHMLGDANNQYVVSEHSLREQLALLQHKLFKVEDFEQLESRLLSKQQLPKYYVVVSFDDGHESALRAADILAEYGVRATFCLTRDRCLKRSGYIRECHIHDLRRRGFSLATHGATHRKLTFMPERECLEELKSSKRWLEDVIGEEVRYMAVPGGYINSRVTSLAYAVGYTLVATCKEWMNSWQTMTLPSLLHRVNVRRDFPLNVFTQIIEGRLRFYVARQVRAVALALPKLLLR